MLETVDTTTGLQDAAERLGVAIGLTFDPTADASERWVAVVGLDSFGAASTPVEAINAALAEYQASAA